MSLRRSISWTLAGKGVYAACQWGTLLVLARMGGLEAVGRFALALAVTGPIVLFSNLSLRHVQATDAGGLHTYGDYVAVRVCSVVLALLAIGGIAALSDYPQETARVIVLVGVAKAFESMSDIVQGLEQVHQRLDLAARSTIVRGVAGVVALAVGYRVSGDLVTAVAAMTAAWATIYVVVDLAAERALLAGDARPAPASAPGERLAQRLRLVRLALPMGVVALLIALNTNVPRYFIEAELGDAALGAYAAMAYFVVAGSFVINGLGQAALVALATRHASGERAAFARLLHRLVGVSLGLGAAGVVVTMLFGRELLVLLYGEAFARDVTAFVWVMVSGAFSYAATALFYAVTARRIFAGQAVLYALVTAIHAVGCALLVDAYGVLGVTWAGIAAFAVQILLNVLLVRRGLAGDERPAPAPVNLVA